MNIGCIPQIFLQDNFLSTYMFDGLNTDACHYKFSVHTITVCYIQFATCNICMCIYIYRYDICIQIDISVYMP